MSMTNAPLSAPYWWDAAGPPTAPPPRPLPPEADVVIVGAGLTGLSAALVLARAGKSVVALDAGAPGIGASGRNGGMLGGGHRLSSTVLEAKFGADTARRLLTEAHLASAAHVRAMIADQGIDCDLQQTGRFRGLHDPALYDPAAREIGRLQDLIGLEAEVIPRADQRAHVASDLYHGGARYLRHMALNPAKFTAGLMDAALRTGAIVQGDTPVTAVTRQGAGWQVASPAGAIRAGQVLMATNGYTPGFAGALRRRIIPVPSYIIATESLGADRIRALFPSNACVVESRDRHCYFRPSPDGTRIVFGGRAAMMPIGQAAATRQLTRLMAQVFPDLGPVGISHSWRGFTGFSFDFLPHMGCHDGIWHAMGYCGSGNAMAPWLGSRAGYAMLGAPEGNTAFGQTPFSSRWWNRGRIGETPWFMPAVQAAFVAKDALRSARRSR
jgi:glycine/D-amino acid oxidase-like deaminating enzyme